MPTLNRCEFMGNLTREPEVRNTQSGTAICDFGIGVNRIVKEKKETLFLDCTAFGKTAEALGKFCQKGSPVYLDGILQQDNWEDKKTGEKRSKIKLVVNNFQMLSKRENTDNAESENRYGKPQLPKNVPPPNIHSFNKSDIPQRQYPKPPEQDNTQGVDEEIPF